eukprot:365295-Chlamydomonas_euryale.AAC.5
MHVTCPPARLLSCPPARLRCSSAFLPYPARLRCSSAFLPYPDHLRCSPASPPYPGHLPCCAACLPCLTNHPVRLNRRLAACPFRSPPNAADLLSCAPTGMKRTQPGPTGCAFTIPAHSG